ncbi:MAG: hypothetical protein ACKVOK_12995 [Flavobacteriales bacterium]
MKKIIPAVLIIAVVLLMASCAGKHQTCAAYDHSVNTETVK